MHPYKLVVLNVCLSLCVVLSGCDDAGSAGSDASAHDGGDSADASPGPDASAHDGGDSADASPGPDASTQDGGDSGPERGPPTGWQDYNSTSRTGAPGAIAVQPGDAGVVDYEYVPQYEVEVDAPEPTGSPSCSGSSSVGNAPDEWIIRDVAGLGELDNTTYTKFFVCPGDYMSAGKTTITRNCTEETPCWMVYYNPDDPGTHPEFWDWDSPHRTHLNTIAPSGASWWNFVRLQWGKFNPDYTPGAEIPKGGGPGTELIPTCSRPNDGSDDILYHQIVCEGFIHHAMGPSTTGQNDRTTIQDSAIRYMRIEDDKDAICILVHRSDGTRIVSNRLYDCTDMVHLGDILSRDAIVENNDMFLTPRMRVDCSSSASAPVQDDDGECACWENFIDIKEQGVGPEPSDPETVIVGNRLHGYRHAHENGVSCGASGGGGTAFAHSNVSDPSWKVRFQNNMVFDAVVPAGLSNAARFHVGISDISENWSFIGNLIEWNNEHGYIQPTMQHNEFYLNTVVGSSRGFFFYDCTKVGGCSNNDGTAEVMCNTFIDVPDPFVGTGELAGDAQVGYNAHINSGSTYERGFTDSSFEESSRANMDFADLRIEYRDEDGPRTHVFPEVVPTGSTPSAFRSLCPGQASADTMGSLLGYGVHDDEADWD